MGNVSSTCLQEAGWNTSWTLWETGSAASQSLAIMMCLAGQSMMEDVCLEYPDAGDRAARSAHLISKLSPKDCWDYFNFTGPDGTVVSDACREEIASVGVRDAGLRAG